MAKKNRKQEIRKQLKKQQQKTQPAQNPDEPDMIMDEQYPEIETFEDIEEEIDTDAVVEYQKEAVPQKTGFFSKIKQQFSRDHKVLEDLDKTADQVMALEPKMRELSDEEFPQYTAQFKERLANGETFDDILVEAYALAREAARRCLGLHAFKVQVMGAIALHHGDIAEMKTGEGKTLTSILPAYLNALDGKGVHIVTVNDYLAGVAAVDNGKVFRFLGLTVGLNKRELNKTEKRQAHACDVTYTTNSELGFDYLRDNMVQRLEDKVLRPLNYAIVDEVDSILIDESRTPLIISGGEQNTASLYIAADRFVKSLDAEKDYEIDVETKSIVLTEAGISRAEKQFKVDNLFDIENTPLVHHINNALRANYIMTRDVEYMVVYHDQENSPDQAEIVIIDQFTGRLMPGRQYSDGLHQAIEAKEGVRIKQETVTLATITYQNFFRLFNKLAGMTGTAKTEEEEFRTIYNMRVIEIPTNAPVIREDAPDLIFATKKAKYDALCDEVVRRHGYGQPLLIGTISVETSQLLSKMLTSRGIRHNVLNAKNHAREAEIIAKAGVRGAVTIATNMAGRGTDIKLGPGVPELGGLAVIGSERHEARRIDNQLRGRSGRQGDPGYSRFYVSFEDDLLVRFGSDRYRSLVNKVVDNEVIESKALTKQIETAQKRVEGQNFDIRKQLLQYDDVMRQQREIMYSQRDLIMSDENPSAIVKDMFAHTMENTVKAYTTTEGKNTRVNVTGVVEMVSKNYMLFADITVHHPEAIAGKPDQLAKALTNIVYDVYDQRYSSDTLPEQRAAYERSVLLGVIDYTWINHIDAMAKLRNGINLRALAQRDPLQEYTQEAFIMFENMNDNIAQEISRRVIRMGLRNLTDEVESIVGHRHIEIDFQQQYGEQ